MNTIVPPYQSSFDKAIPVILRHEGGWVDDPDDPGGETNFGISESFIQQEGLLPADLGLPNFKKGCMHFLTVEKAKELYLHCFWTRFGIGRLADQAVATKVFDAAVNCGGHQAVKLAQRAIGVTDDGFLGPVTVSAINSVVPIAFLAAFIQQMERYYKALTVARPKSLKFLPQWLKRAADIPKF